MCALLTSLNEINDTVQRPGYLPEQHGVGIVHIGVGAFHRAHQALITDDALAKHGGDWRIVGASLRSKDIAKELNAQNGLYTLLERGATATTARVVASIDHVIAADADAILSMLCKPCIRVVTITVSEAGYGIDRKSQLPDKNNPMVAADVANPDKAAGVLGLLVTAIHRRREAGIDPFSVLSCDNLASNGKYLRSGVVGFARIAYGDELADWLSTHIAFPSSMVDRITPASTQDTYQDAAHLTGCEDKAAIETEPFCQWIIEDNFPSGRPKWEAGGASFVADVSPYEHMKLTMLNGCHSMLAYSGYLTGKTFVRDVMQDEHLVRLVRRHLSAAAFVLNELPGIDYAEYASALAERFSNPAIAHQTLQIASDGTQKLPQRIFQPAIDTLNTNGDVRPFAFATAMWMRYCLGKGDENVEYELKDPRAAEIADAVTDCAHDAVLLSEALHSLPNLIPPELSSNDEWRSSINDILLFILQSGCIAAVEREAKIAH